MKYFKKVAALLLFALIFVAGGITASAKGNGTIKTGISIGPVDVSGMTADEATGAVEIYLSGAGEQEITVKLINGEEIGLPVENLEIGWSNTEVVDEALSYGTKGSVLSRYKEIKDLENGGKVLPLEISYNKEAVETFVAEKVTMADKKAVSAGIKRESDGSFDVTEGSDGYITDVEGSVAVLNDTLKAGIDVALGAPVEMVGEVDKPKGNTDDLSQIKDLIGSFTTKYTNSGASRCKNVANGCSLINGSVVYPGDTFSVYDAVKPFTAANGYDMAGSYLNGQVVDSMGGGICQVSTTLYNAALRAELEIVERNNHSMVVNYVQVSGDAAISESSGKDFKFKNNTEYPIFIEGYTENKTITFNIYGVETRPKNRTVEYENEILQTIQPDHENIVADASHGIGYVNVTSAHIGYKARLWKIVKEDGKEVSREQVNSSSYTVAPRTAVIGIATANAEHQQILMAAIATGNIDYAKSVAGGLHLLEIGGN